MFFCLNFDPKKYCHCVLGSQSDVDFERLEDEPSLVELPISPASEVSEFPLDDVIKQLEETESLHSQADLLHYLHSTV